MFLLTEYKKYNGFRSKKNLTLTQRPCAKVQQKKKNDKIYKLISLSLSMQLTYCYLSEPERRDREAHNEQNLEKKQDMAEEA